MYHTQCLRQVAKHVNPSEDPTGNDQSAMLYVLGDHTRRS